MTEISEAKNNVKSSQSDVVPPKKLGRSGYRPRLVVVSVIVICSFSLFVASSG